MFRVRASAEVESFSSQISGRVTTGDAVNAAEPIFRTPNSLAAHESVAANAWTYMSSIITSIIVIDHEDEYVTIHECIELANSTGSKKCGAVGV